MPFRVRPFLRIRTVVALMFLLQLFVERGIEGIHLDSSVLEVVLDVEQMLLVVETDHASVDDRITIRNSLVQYVRFGFLGLHPPQAEQHRKKGESLFHGEPRPQGIGPPPETERSSAMCRSRVRDEGARWGHRILTFACICWPSGRLTGAGRAREGPVNSAKLKRRYLLLFDHNQLHCVRCGRWLGFMRLPYD
jgi:hypothetical protein